MSNHTPEQLKLSSMADYLAALDRLCQMAEHSLYFFDKDFDRLGFNSEERFNTLRSFLLGSPTHKLYLLAHDTQYLSTKCPRMINLLHQFTTNMSIYQTPKNLQHIAIPFAVADDEHLVRMSTADMLIDLGFAVVEAASAEEALAAIDRGVHFDLLVTDHLMPGMTGVDLAGLVQKQRPGIPVLLVSGYADAHGVASSMPRLIKPFRQAELAAILSGLIAAVEV